MLGWKKYNAISRSLEEAIYEAVAEEMRNGLRRDGLWVKAFSQASGDEIKAQAIYIELRKQAFIDEMVLDAVGAGIEAAEEKKALETRLKHLKRLEKELGQKIIAQHKIKELWKRKLFIDPTERAAKISTAQAIGERLVNQLDLTIDEIKRIEGQLNHQ